MIWRKENPKNKRNGLCNIPGNKKIMRVKLSWSRVTQNQYFAFKLLRGGPWGIHSFCPYFFMILWGLVEKCQNCSILRASYSFLTSQLLNCFVAISNTLYHTLQEGYAENTIRCVHSHAHMYTHTYTTNRWCQHLFFHFIWQVVAMMKI